MNSLVQSSQLSYTSNRTMSALGQKRTSKHVQPMSALPPKADIAERDLACPLCAKSGHCSASIDVRYSLESGGGFNVAITEPRDQAGCSLQTANGGSYDCAICRRAGF